MKKRFRKRLYGHLNKNIVCYSHTGFMENYVIHTYGYEGRGSLKHIHITCPDGRKVSVDLESNSYYKHKEYKDVFTDDEAEQFNEMMNSKSDFQCRFCPDTIHSLYGIICFFWEGDCRNTKIRVKTQPDYTLLNKK